MMTQKKSKPYTSKRKLVQGRGFVDSLTNIFNNLKSVTLPHLRTIGSYVAKNKDLIAKPVLGAVGELSAMALTAAGRKILDRMENKAFKPEEILQSITSSGTKPEEILQLPKENIIGSGLKKIF
jgi:hypothetical protein